MLRYSFLAVWSIMFAVRPVPFATFLSAFGFRNQTLVRLNSTNPLLGLFVIFSCAATVGCLCLPVDEPLVPALICLFLCLYAGQRRFVKGKRSVTSGSGSFYSFSPKSAQSSFFSASSSPFVVLDTPPRPGVSLPSVLSTGSCNPQLYAATPPAPLGNFIPVLPPVTVVLFFRFFVTTGFSCLWVAVSCCPTRPARLNLFCFNTLRGRGHGPTCLTLQGDP